MNAKVRIKVMEKTHLSTAVCCRKCFFYNDKLFAHPQIQKFILGFFFSLTKGDSVEKYLLNKSDPIRNLAEKQEKRRRRRKLFESSTLLLYAIP